MEVYIFFQVLVIILFFTAFFTKQEIVWGLTSVMSAVLMFTSYNIEYYVYLYNETILAYAPVFETHSYPYLMGINLLFLGLSLVLGFFDVFDKYGSRLIGENPKPPGQP